MKRLTIVALAAISLLYTPAVFAGSFDYLSNQSAGYFMNMAKTATTDGADAAAYNPAGTALMGKGFYFDIGNQFLFKTYSEESKGPVLADSFDQSKPTLLLPNLHIVYNAGALGPGTLAVFGSAGAVAGGGDLNWEDGTIGSASYVKSLGTVPSFTTSVEASSAYYGFGGGVSYALLDGKVSASAGARYVSAQRSGKIEGTLNFGAFTIDAIDDYEYNAQGFTPIFGLNVRPVDGLTLGVRYEMETALSFKYKTNKVDATTTSSNSTALGTAAIVKGKLPNYDGQKVDHNLPHILSLGADYQVTQQLGVSLAGTLYFMGATAYDTPETKDGAGDSLDVASYFNTGYEVGVGARYQVLENLLVGGSFLYSNQGAKSSLMEKGGSYLLTTSANPVLDSVTGGLGVQFTAIKNLDLLLSGAWIQYLTKDVDVTAGSSKLELTYEKRVINLSVGAKYKF